VVLGIGLAMIFVPLTTVTLSTIPREEMGNATGIFSLLRNVGGSVGIAISSTLLARDAQFYQTQLSAHTSAYSPAFLKALAAVKQAVIARGISFNADNTALAMIYGTVRRQAGIQAYNHIFWVVGLAFIGIIPLLLLLKRPHHETAPGGHH